MSGAAYRAANRACREIIEISSLNGPQSSPARARHSDVAIRTRALRR